MARSSTSSKGSGKAAHRRPDMPHRNVPKGQCKWCGDFIWRKPGKSKKAAASPDDTPTLNLRKNWHDHCVDAYKEAAWPGYARRKVYRRDKGKCARCDMQACKGWHLDHIVPLIDGGSFTLDNMQTLCAECHRAKTAAEATARAERRRLEPTPLADDIPPDEAIQWLDDGSDFEAGWE